MSVRTSQSQTQIPWVLFAIGMASIAAHVWSALAGHHEAWMTGFMVATAVACLPCTALLLRGCSKKSLAVMMGLATVSATVHGLSFLSTLMPISGHGSHLNHGASQLTVAITGSAAGHGVELIMIIVLEIAVLILASDLRSRRNVDPTVIEQFG